MLQALFTRESTANQQEKEQANLAYFVKSAAEQLKKVGDRAALRTWAQRSESLRYLLAIEQLALQVDGHGPWRGTIFRTSLAMSRLSDSFESAQLEALSGESHAVGTHNPGQLGLADVQVVAQALSRLGYGSTAAAAMRFLIDLGIYRSNLNNFMHGLYRPLLCEESLQALGQQLSESPPADRDAFVRREFKAAAFAIDDNVSGIEVDDAISIGSADETDEASVHIHIADVTRWVEPHSELDAKLRERASSVYLPDREFLMLPNALIRACSLASDGQPRCALTVSVTLDEDGAVRRYRIAPTMLTNIVRLGYFHADSILGPPASVADGSFAEALTQPPIPRGPQGSRLSPKDQIAIRLLNGWSRTRALHRNGNRAANLRVVRPDIHVKAGEVVDVLSSFDDASSARVMVQEMMVLAGEVLADFAQRNSLPILFRSQSGFRREESTSAGSMLLKVGWDMKMVHDMRFLAPKSRFVPDAQAHSGLGLRAYVQGTSPLRRYLDILVHWQVKACLRGGTPPYDHTELESISALTSPRLAEIQRLQTVSRRYWVLRYISRLKSSESKMKLCGVVLAVKPMESPPSSKSATLLAPLVVEVVLVDFALRTTVPIHADNVRSGDVVDIWVSRVSPETLELDGTAHVVPVPATDLETSEAEMAPGKARPKRRSLRAGSTSASSAGS